MALSYRVRFSADTPKEELKMRKLASIQKITELNDIPNSDFLQVASINGWKVVVQKGLYEVGDKCTYFEIDSILPLDLFPELEKYKGRIRTIKLRGQISQGYCVPLPNQSLEEGLDVTAVLGVTKYEPPEEFRSGDAAGSFPSHIISKTDEDRIQSNLELLELFKSKPFTATLKCDGTSGTWGYDENEFFACSRNLKVKDGDNVYWNMARKYDLEKKLKVCQTPYVVQAEICGPGIQKNRLGLTHHEIRVFRVYDKFRKRFLNCTEMIRFCEVNELPMAEVILFGDKFEYNLETLLMLAEGKYPGTNNEREGIVFICEEEDQTKFGGRLSFKVISNKYLLDGGE